MSLVFFSAQTLAKEALFLSLRDTILLSLRFNPSVQSGEIQRVIDKINLRVAQWNYELHYTLTGTVNYTNSISNGAGSRTNNQNLIPGTTLLTPIGTQLSVQMQNPVTQASGGSARYYNPGVTLSITQPLLQGSGVDVVLAPLHQAENQEILNQLTLKNTVMQTVTTAVGQYAALAQAQNSLTAQKLMMANSIATLNQQKAYLKTGRIASADLVQFQATVANQQLQVEQQEVSIQQQKQQLLITLGIDPNIPFNVSKEVRFDDESLPSLNECIRLALKNNIAYQQQLIAVKQAKISLLLAEDQQRWQLNFVAARTQGNGSGGAPNSGLASIGNGTNSNTALGLTLSVPIDNLTLKQQLAQAKVGLKQQLIQLNAQKYQVINNVTTAYYTVLNQKRQIVQAKLAVQLARQSMDVSQAKLKFGKTTAFEVSTLQTTLTTQIITYINTETAYVTNLATLDQTVGTTLQRWNLQIKY